MSRAAITRLALLSLGWGLVQSVLARVRGEAVDPAAVALQAGSAAAIVLALALAGFRSGRAGGSRLLALAVLAWWVPYASSLVEAVVFDVIGGSSVPPALASSAVTALVLAAGVHAVLPAPETREVAPSRETRKAWTLLPRMLLAVAGFVVAYVAAGMVAFPFVREYYAGRAMPSVGLLLGVQLVRGLGLVLATLPLLARAEDRGWARAVRWGMVLVLLASVAPLLPRSTLMPGSVRLVHGLELASSHLMAGLLFAWLLGPRVVRRPVAASGPGA